MTDKALYYVYLRGNDNGFVVSYNEIPSLQMKGKRKYAGKKAKIEAVYRLNGYRIPDVSGTSGKRRIGINRVPAAAFLGCRFDTGFLPDPG